jgi:hypothetical protein
VEQFWRKNPKETAKMRWEGKRKCTQTYVGHTYVAKKKNKPETMANERTKAPNKQSERARTKNPVNATMRASNGVMFSVTPLRHAAVVCRNGVCWFGRSVVRSKKDPIEQRSGGAGEEEEDRRGRKRRVERSREREETKKHQSEMHK